MAPQPSRVLRCNKALKIYRMLLAFLVPLLFTLNAVSAAADDPRNASVGPAEKDNSTALQQITVTAQKFRQNAQQVPIAISAFDADELANRQIFGLADIKYLVPNLYLEDNLSNTGTPKIFMRGIGQANSAFSFDSPIGIYVDDVYYPKEIGSLVDFFDIDHIEVLRGPQGTIYGRNSSIGAIRIVTKSAPLDTADAMGDVSFGTNNQRNARLDFGVPLIQDKMGFRLAFNSKHNDGYQIDTVNGDRADSDNSYAVRAQLLTKFSEAFSATFRTDFLRDDSRPPVATNFINNDLRSLRYQSELSYSQGTARSRQETFGASLTLNWKFGEDDLTSVSAWRGVNTVNAFDADGTTLPSFEVPASDLVDRSLTQEIFITSKKLWTMPVDWVAGVFYLHEPTHYIYSMQIFAPASVQYYNQLVDSAAGYLQGTYHFTDALALTVGGRYTTEHKDFDVTSHLADGTFDFAYSDHSLSTNRATWRGALDYQVKPAILFYASAATGFRSGGLNGNALSLADVTGGAFQPEETLMYELGMKSEFLDHRLRVNADYFYGDYHNLQQPVVESNGNVSNINNNAYVNGLELETEAVLFPGMKVSANVGTLNNTIGGSSKKLPNAAHLNWTLAARYSRDVASIGVASGGISWSHTGSTFEDATNTLMTEVSAHDNLDANLSWSTPDEHWLFTLAGKNLINRIYPVGGFYIAGGFIAAVEWPSLPRRWLMSVQYKY